MQDLGHEPAEVRAAGAGAQQIGAGEDDEQHESRERQPEHVARAQAPAGQPEPCQPEDRRQGQQAADVAAQAGQAVQQGDDDERDGDRRQRLAAVALDREAGGEHGRGGDQRKARVGHAVEAPPARQRVPPASSSCAASRPSRRRCPRPRDASPHAPAGAIGHNRPADLNSMSRSQSSTGEHAATSPLRSVMIADEVARPDYRPHYLWKLLIDGRYQRQGLGTATLGPDRRVLPWPTRGRAAEHERRSGRRQPDHLLRALRLRADRRIVVRR